jgi:hypothetical protein
LAKAYICFDGAKWQNEGNVAFSGLAFGTITSQPVSEFNAAGTPTPFTLGSSSALFNPLPVFLVSFEADHRSSGQTFLRWRLSEYPSAPCSFILERDQGTGFVQIAELQCTNNLVEYEYLIPNPVIESCRYRLRMQNAESGTVFSEVITIHPAVVNPAMAYIMNTGYLRFYSTRREIVVVSITDMQGRVVQKKSYSLDVGTNQFMFPVSHFAAGVYLLVLQTAKGDFESLKLKL